MLNVTQHPRLIYYEYANEPRLHSLRDPLVDDHTFLFFSS